MPTQPNSNLETRVGSALPSSVCLFFFSRIERLSSKLDALTRFSAPLLLRPRILPRLQVCKVGGYKTLTRWA